MTPKLLFLDDDKGEEGYELKPEGTTIGRETDNDIILQEGEISRHHARILEKDGQWIFKDLGSGLGTKVNDEPVKDSEQVLNPGDLIVMGRHRFKFEPGISEVTIMGNLQAPKPEDIEKAKKEAEELTSKEPAGEEPEKDPAAEELFSLVEEMAKKEKPDSLSAEEADDEVENPEEDMETVTLNAVPPRKPAEEFEEKIEEETESPVEEPKDSPYAKKESAAEEPESKPETEEPKKEITTAKETPKTVPSTPPSTEKKGGLKFLFGCGGCGCFLTLIMIPAGIFMIAMGSDSHLSELGPFGVIVTPLGVLAGIVSAILIIIGLVMKKKKK